MATSDKTFTNNAAPDVEDVDYNGFVLETNNAISGSGQTLTILDRTQLRKAQAIYASRGDFYQEAGGSAADLYVLEGASNPMVPNQPEIIALRDGMRIRWRVTNANTGASTIDVAGLGAKDIEIAGNALISGDLPVGKEAVMTFDLSNDNFQLEDSLSTRDRSVAKAWINFDGTGATNVRDSFNITGIVDNGIGNYTINFDNDMANTDYLIVAGYEPDLKSFTTQTTRVLFIDSQAVGSFNILTGAQDTSGGGALDFPVICLTIFGDLA